MSNETNYLTTPRESLRQQFRALVSNYIEKGQYDSACFWASKALNLGTDNDDEINTHDEEYIQDIFAFANALFLTKQYHRSAHALLSRKLEGRDLKSCILAAKCLYTAQDFEEAHSVILAGSSLVDLSSSLSSKETKTTLSSFYLIKGLILEALESRVLATEAFKAALKEDVTSSAAFSALVRHQSLSAEEEFDLLASLPFEEQCGSEMGALVKGLYEMSLKKYDRPSNIIFPVNLSALKNNTDVLVWKAERHFYNCDYRECFSLTCKVIKEDPFHSECLPIHITCMVELEDSDSLFQLAHKLVDLYPESSISWFAVGCYYYVVDKHEPARRYLAKATQLDRVFGPAWLAYGHSFAKENEHDQAMAAYFKACQLLKGCHLPLLYIGVEYSLTNNSKLAEQFFSEALSIAPKDPFVLHEMGVLSFQNHDYVGAELYLNGAWDQVQSIHESSILSPKWEALLNNLGHVSRKLGKYNEALEYHRQALVLRPKNASTYSAIGYAQSLNGNLLEAVEAFHKALGLQDDTFSTSMLNNVIEMLMNTAPPFSDYPEQIPKFDVSDLETRKKSPTLVASSLEEQSLHQSSFDVDMSDGAVVDKMDLTQ